MKKRQRLNAKARNLQNILRDIFIEYRQGKIPYDLFVVSVLNRYRQAKADNLHTQIFDAWELESLEERDPFPVYKRMIKSGFKFYMKQIK